MNVDALFSQTAYIGPAFDWIMAATAGVKEVTVMITEGNMYNNKCQDLQPCLQQPAVQSVTA